MPRRQRDRLRAQLSLWADCGDGGQPEAQRCGKYDPSFVATASPSFADGWLGMLNGDASKVSPGVLPTLWTLTGPVLHPRWPAVWHRDVPLSHPPRGTGILLAAGTPLAPWPDCFPLGGSRKLRYRRGLVLDWLGYVLWSERPTRASQPSNRTMETV